MNTLIHKEIMKKINAEIEEGIISDTKRIKIELIAVRQKTFVGKPFKNNICTVFALDLETGDAKALFTCKEENIKKQMVANFTNAFAMMSISNGMSQ